MDWPVRLLTAAVRRMAAERSEWGVAMLAELAQLQQPFARWQFALGCTRVALFPPRQKGVWQNLMETKTKSLLTSLGLAALIGLLCIAPLAYLEMRYNQARRASDFAALFGLLWLMPAVFTLTSVPVVRSLRAGVLAHPMTLALRVTFMILVALCWISLVRDQLPCFLGVPNCD